MEPDSVKSTLSTLALGNVMAAAARDYQKELLAQEKTDASSKECEEFDLDELINDPELEKLHADRLAKFKKEAERREALKKQGYGEYRVVDESEFLSEVTNSDRVICHFFHSEFYRCKVMDKHLEELARRHLDVKFIKLDVENAPFFAAKLHVRTLPCVILFRKGIAKDRLVGFQDLGSNDDFTTKRLEDYLIRKGMIASHKDSPSAKRSIRSSVCAGSDSD